MTLRFKWEWESGTGVRIPELATTWCRLSIDIDETPATLVERRDGTGGPRHGLDVSAYPLAEFLAVNWWRLSAIAHVPTDRGIRLVDAGAGFPWPDLTVRSDRGLMWATLRQRDNEPEHVRFLTQAETVFDAQAGLAAAADFIDATVRRLTQSGVEGTLLQEEWSAIQHADHDEREYCLVAAAWGEDPYDTPAEVEERLLRAAAQIGNTSLLSDLAGAIPQDQILGSTPWLIEATKSVAAQQLNLLNLPPLGSVDWSSAAGVAPWKIGYERARRLRDLLGLKPAVPAAIDELLTLHHTQSPPPTNIDGMVSTGAGALAVVVGSGASLRATRFAAARALGRYSLAPMQSLSLLTRGTHYTERAERAFAAEILAPAMGIRDRLDGDFSEGAVQRVAEHFNVSTILIEHQIENQIAA